MCISAASTSDGTPIDRHQGESERESERDRLLRVWRLHPEAVVDLCSEEDSHGPHDGGVTVELQAPNGSPIDQFLFASVEEADLAVDFAMRAMNPGSHR